MGEVGSEDYIDGGDSVCTLKDDEKMMKYEDMFYEV